MIKVAKSVGQCNWGNGADKRSFFEIRVQYDRGILGIQVKNTFDGKVNKQGERLLTRKKQQALHGIGM